MDDMGKELAIEITMRTALQMYLDDGASGIKASIIYADGNTYQVEISIEVEKED